MTRTIDRTVGRSLALSLLFALACGRSDAASVAPVPVTARSVVEWAPWQRATFLRARAENRLILVNVVATWCHWCHVMEETTYADPEVAELLATHFVTIRVDSDARPDVAERYREWGWPATGFLSPDAQPVLELRGYRNPREFAKLLRSLVADRDAGELAHREAPLVAQPSGAVALADVRSFVVAQLDHYFEPELGGWGKRQRYPWPAPVEHALGRARARGETIWHERALLTLASSLLADADVDASEIDVRVQDGEVTLEGTVHDRWSKREAENIACRARGVKDCHNRLRVSA